jgi:hypothetical protein
MIQIDPDLYRLLVYWGVIGLCLGSVGAGLGSFKGRALFGFFLGAFIGPIGWIIVLLLPDARQRNPFGK